MNKLIPIIILILVAGYQFYTSKPVTNTTNTTTIAIPSKTNNVLGAFTIGNRTKTTNCTPNGTIQDTSCTPGAIIKTATTDQICQSGYSASVRNVPSETKNMVFEEYGIVSHSPGQYEVDHLISLELGGSNDVANLWPEAADPRPGFHEKDQVENYLHQQICNGSLSLQEAQYEISHNWLDVYNKIPH